MKVPAHISKSTFLICYYLRYCLIVIVIDQFAHCLCLIAYGFLCAMALMLRFFNFLLFNFLND